MPDILLTLLTLGSCFALGAFIFSLKLGNRQRSISAFALFVAMLALLLYAMYPAYEAPLGVLAVAAAGVYAFLALKRRRDESSKALGQSRKPDDQ